MMGRRILTLALLLAAAPACHHDDIAVLLVVVTASGTPPSVTTLNVTITGPAEPSSNSYTRDGQQAIVFPTTLSAQLPVRVTGNLNIDVDAINAAGVTVASGHGGPITIHAGERQTVYVRLDCGGNDCVVDGGTGGGDGGNPTPSPRCGNGRVDPGETCDTAIAAGAPGACPPSCDDHIPCTKDTRDGSDCTVVCAHNEIREVKRGDGCCPDETDPDCSPTCGNAIVDPGETCDLAIMRGVAGACPITSDCTPGAACATSLLVSAGTCSAVCVRYPIVAQSGKDSDGCCPPGATNAVDEDCATACGNGLIEASERCDVGIPPLAPGACPTSCDDLDPCTTDSSSAVGCQVFCQHFAIKSPVSGDGCCPDGATRATDTDCAPRCHNGVIEPGETCEDRTPCPTSCPPPPPLRADLAGCLSVDLVGDPNACTSRCVVREETECKPASDQCCPSGCKAENDPDCSPGCGNTALDFTRGEVCDIAAPPNDLNHCPTSCADTNPCTEDRLVSAGTCAAVCDYLPITAFRAGDGCCPQGVGANFLVDPDCPSMCGNGVVESPFERCDWIISGSCPGLLDNSCPQPVGCTRYTVQGSASSCSATCVAMPITAPADHDDCCPKGFTRADDSDCPVICGDGVVESGESCDRAITAGAPGACQRTCDDGIACTLDLASGSPEGCTRTCTHQPITGCVSDDGCCPQGCSGATDRDCDPSCGDGRIGAGETCDPPSTCPTSCPDDGDPCTRELLTGEAASCSAVCRHAPVTACSGAVRDSCCPTGCTSTNDQDC